MILIDTSVWVDFLNNKSNVGVKKLEKLLNDNQEICTTGIIITEVLQGIGKDKEYLRTKSIILELPYLPIKEKQTFLHASEIYRSCRKAGITVRKTIDCLIAAIAIENDVLLLTNDKDFSGIAKNTSLKLH
ncbi:MAG: PIN domain nuclease [Leptospiraceae bacterium]|nr:PIN domain nuclease [Leptospiraceae bacterium]MCP5501815.1 PIN domain nuclease [Leptospiraceae bacterium]